MSNYNNLKSSINNNIYENQTQQITGTVLNAILNEMTNALGAGYQFAGVATVGMTPSEPDARIFYLAGEGIYTSFDGIQVPAGKLGILKWDNRWHLETIDGLGGGGANLTGYVSVASTDDLPDEGQPTLGYLCGTNLYLYVGTGGDTKEGKYQNCGSFRGPQGLQGDPGVGIATVTQTTTSTEDEGINVITVTKEDGTQSTFQVRNGSKGSQGIQGPQGVQGEPGRLQAQYKEVETLPTASADTVDYIYLVASQTPNTYDMYYTEENQGAYSWKSLGTTAVQLSDYATKAEVNQLEAKVDGFNGGTITQNDCTVVNGFIDTSKTFRDSPGRCCLYKFKWYDKKVKITANPSGATYYAFLTSNSLTNGQTAPLVSGTNLVTLTAGTASSDLNIPTGAVYLYLYASTTNAGTLERFPQQILISGKAAGIDEKVDNLNNQVGIVNTGVWEVGSINADVNNTGSISNYASTTRIRPKGQFTVEKPCTIYFKCNSGYSVMLLVAMNKKSTADWLTMQSYDFVAGDVFRMAIRKDDNTSFSGYTQSQIDQVLANSGFECYSIDEAIRLDNMEKNIKSIETITYTIPDWSADTVYVVGNQVRNGGNIYRCTTAHTSDGSFDSTKWTQVTNLYEDLTELYPKYGKVLSLVGSGATVNEATATPKVGDIYYNTSGHYLSMYYASPSTFKFIPFEDNGLYLMGGDIYRWNGSDLVLCNDGQINNFAKSIGDLTAGVGWAGNKAISPDGSIATLNSGMLVSDAIQLDNVKKIAFNRCVSTAQNATGYSVLCFYSDAAGTTKVSEVSIHYYGSYVGYEQMVIDVPDTAVSVRFAKWANESGRGYFFAFSEPFSTLFDVPEKVVSLENTDYVFTARNHILKEIDVEGTPYFKYSADGGASWVELENTIGDIMFVHFFTDGSCLICSPTKAYYTEDFSELTEATVYDYDGSVFSANNRNFFYLFADCSENYTIEGKEAFVWSDYGGPSGYVSRIWYTEDKGHTLRCILRDGSTISGGVTLDIRHFHDCRWDKYENCVWITTGDVGDACCLIKGTISGGVWTFERINKGTTWKFGQIIVREKVLFLVTDFNEGDVQTGIVVLDKANLTSYQYIYKTANKKPLTGYFQDAEGWRILAYDGTTYNKMLVADRDMNFKDIAVALSVNGVSQSISVGHPIGPNYNGELIVLGGTTNITDMKLNRSARFILSYAMRNAGFKNFGKIDF